MNDKPEIDDVDEFVAAVRKGLAELDRGEGIPIEEIEGELPSFVVKQVSKLP